jgi:two-component system cell cycle response regulator DivK
MARILIVEDSPTNMTLAVFILNSAGHITLQAETAGQGIELAMRERPDLVLMDMQLPDMDGMAATRILKASAETRDIPVVALTASAMKGDKERMLLAGCDAYIEKPFNYQELLAEVDTLCKR